jgi:subtilisin family serine protease
MKSTLVKSFPTWVRSAVGSTVLIVLLSAFSFVSRPAFSQNQPVRYKTVHVKFKEAFIPNHSGRSTRSGMQAMDLVSEKYAATSMERIFPDAGKFEKAHQAYGLHLWYEIKFPQGADTARAIIEYKNLDYFEKVEPCREYTAGWDRNEDAIEVSSTSILTGGANDPLYKDQWHYKNTGQTGGTPGADINLEKGWRIETGSSNVIVAIIDGGVDVIHPDLKDALWTNADEIPGNGIDDDQNGYKDDIHGYNFGDGESTVYPDVHGTHVAGTIGAISNNGIGVAGVAGGSGSANGVRIMTLSSFGKFSNGGFESAMVYAADNGAVISQNSWGGGSTAIEAAIGYFIDRAGLDNTHANFDAKIQTGPMAGGIVIFAAGNDNTSDALFGYPGSFPRVMAVASLNRFDTKAGTSNYGGWVDISAPGDQVLSTKPGATYGLLSGTSMACPHVSGVAALLISYLQQPGLKPSEIRNRIIQSAKPIDDKNPFYIGQLGAGKINAFSMFGKRDLIPPGAITDLHATTVKSNSITLQWTAPAESGNEGGPPEKYDIRMSASPITEENFLNATVISAPIPAQPGQQQTFTINSGSFQATMYFAIKSTDVYYFTSALSNVAAVSRPLPGLLEISNGEIIEELKLGAEATYDIELKNADVRDLTFKMVYPDDKALSWVTFSTELIHLMPGEIKHTSISLNAVGVVSGAYTGQVWFSSEDDGTLNTINLILTIADIGLKFDNLIDFKNRYTNSTYDSTITLRNDNLTELIISDIQSSDSRVTTSVSTLTLEPGEEKPLTISINSTTSGLLNAVLTLATNEPGIETVDLRVRANLIKNPEISVDRESIDAMLSLSETKAYTVTVTNTGTDPFHWTTNYPATGQPSANLGQFVAKASGPVELTALSYDPDGGFIYGKARSTAAFYRYNFSANNWTSLAAGPTTILGQAVYLNGKIYHSGQKLEVYNIALNSWTSITYPVAGTSISITTDGSYLYTALAKTLYRYDPVADTWLELVTLTGGYSTGVGALSYWNGIIYVAEDASTGIQGDSNTPFYKYYIGSNTWLRTSNLKGKVSWGSAIDPVSGQYYAHQSNRIGSGTQLDIRNLRENTEVQQTKTFVTGSDGSMVYVSQAGFTGIYSVHGSSFFRYETSPIPASWILVSPAQGELPAGGVQNLNVQLCGVGLDEGTHTASLNILQIESGVAVKTIPVTATITNSPDISLKASAINLGEIATGNQTNVSLTIRNYGTAPLQINTIAFDRPEISASTVSYVIPAGESVAALITLQPIASGNFTGTITLHSNDPDEPEVQATVNAIAQTFSAPEITPSSLSVSVFSGTRDLQNLIVSNIGEGTILADMGFEGNNWTHVFYDNYIIPGGQTQVFQLEIDAAGKTTGVYEGKAILYSRSSQGRSFPDVEIPVSISVTSAPGIRLSTETINFGNRYLGGTYEETFQVTNQGVLPLSVTTIHVDNPAFILDEVSPLVLQPGESAAVKVQFIPTEVGNKSGNITFTSNDPDQGTYSIPVSGAGVTLPSLNVSVSEIRESAFTGEIKSQLLSILNTGGSDLLWNFVFVVNGTESETAPDWLSISLNSGVIEKSDDQEIEMNFSAHNLNTGTYEATIKLQSNDPDDLVHEIPVTFEVSYPGAVIKVPELLEGNLNRSASISTTLRIENTGAAPLEWSLPATQLPVGLTISKSSGVIAPAGFENVTVSYVPGFFSPRIFEYTVEINSNDQFYPTVSTQLSFVVTTALNRAPVVEQTYEDISAVIGTPPLEVLISETFSDPEGDAIQYTAKASDDQVASLNLIDNRLKIFIFKTGSTRITLTGTDTFDYSVSTNFDVTITEVVTGVEPGIEKSLSAYPNPFTHQVSIRYTTEKPTHAIILLFDTSGKMVWQSNDYTETPGINEILINEAQLPSGIYHARLLRRDNPPVTVRVMKQ